MYERFFTFMKNSCLESKELSSRRVLDMGGN